MPSAVISRSAIRWATNSVMVCPTPVQPAPLDLRSIQQRLFSTQPAQGGFLIHVLSTSVKISPVAPAFPPTPGALSVPTPGAQHIRAKWSVLPQWWHLFLIRPSRSPPPQPLSRPSPRPLRSTGSFPRPSDPSEPLMKPDSEVSTV